jgi:hypothetical protein
VYGGVCDISLHMTVLTSLALHRVDLALRNSEVYTTLFHHR